MKIVKTQHASSNPSVIRCITEHLERYRLTVPEALVAQSPSLFSNADRAKRHCSQLAASGPLGWATLYRNRRFFYLAMPGDRQVTQERFSETTKIRSFAMLALCCLGTSPRARLTRVELQTHFPDVYRPGVPLNYYVDVNISPPRLGFVRVDLGGHGRWDRIVAKVCDDGQSHWNHPGTRALIERGSLELHLVTALPQKAQRVHDALQDKSIARKVPVRVTAVPELMNLIAPPSCKHR